MLTPSLRFARLPTVENENRTVIVCTAMLLNISRASPYTKIFNFAVRYVGCWFVRLLLFSFFSLLFVVVFFFLFSRIHFNID